MFGDVFRRYLHWADKVGTEDGLSGAQTLSLIEKCVRSPDLDPEEIAALLSAASEEENRKVILDFAARYKRPHNREILLLPPLYFSSICENRCQYCDFSASGKRLSLEEFRREFRALLKRGYRSIELVSGQDPGLFVHRKPFDLSRQAYDIEGAAAYFRIAREELDQNGGGMVTSNIPPVDGESLGRLRDNGLDCYLSWVETFDPAQYARLHNPRGPKINQAFRLNAYERAREAGIPHVAGAFLKGLSDWKKEEFLLYFLDSHLRRKTGRGFSIIGTPRIKGSFCSSPLISGTAMSDDDYELNIALDRILFDGILWLQTRETPSLNRSLINRYGGGIILTPDCSTAPGGYSRPTSATPQFPVYRQNVKTAVGRLEADGFEVRYAWDAGTLASFRRDRPAKKDFES
ncbi:MAG: radical SAM protein [Candidatus Aminicenantes bacterium]|nr:radical SAM protein [Candidatus Aminicenantes bacterium]